MWELIGYNTDQRYDDVRYRNYTNSAIKAALFDKIPKIQFSDSGHGIVFSSRLVSLEKPCPTCGHKKRGGIKKKTISTVARYVNEQLAILNGGGRK